MKRGKPGRPPSLVYQEHDIAGPKELAEISGVAERTLNHWQKTRPFVFKAVLEKARRAKKLWGYQRGASKNKTNRT